MIFAQVEKQVLANNMEKLELLVSGKDAKVNLETAVRGLRELVSPFAYRISSMIYRFTPQKIQVAGLIREGK